MSIAEVQQRYQRFASDEAPGRSAVYERWAAVIAANPEAAAVIAALPRDRRQPPLVFAVLRLLGADVGECGDVRRFLLERAADLADAIRSRSLQTNEPQRCAALLPALSLIDGPIALIELGASAGLCLYPDRYAYRFAGERVVECAPPTGSAVLLECDVRGDALPELRLPEVVSRTGADLHPLDVTAPEDSAWLEALVWPGELGRAERIAAACRIAAADPPRLVAGDAHAALEGLVADAPAGATIVVTTPGLLPFLPWRERAALIDHIRALPVRWITLDAPQLHDGWNAPPPPGAGFALALDGEVLADVDPLGAWIHWHCDRAPGGVSEA